MSSYFIACAQRREECASANLLEIKNANLQKAINNSFLGLKTTSTSFIS